MGSGSGKRKVRCGDGVDDYAVDRLGYRLVNMSLS